MRVTLQPAFVLHRRLLNETSLILDLFTVEYGRLNVVAKNVRSKQSKWRGLLRSFVPLLVSWSGKNELMYLNTAEISGTALQLTAGDLLSGIYLNELLVRALPRLEAFNTLFYAYNHTLSILEKSENSAKEGSLRLFEKLLLQELGYGLTLSQEANNNTAIDPQRYYRFKATDGCYECNPDDQAIDVFKGKYLLALDQGILQTKEELQAAKRLNRQAIATVLGKHTLKSSFIFQNSFISPKKEEL